MTDQPMTFEEYVNQWDALVAQIEALKKQLKPLTDAEMPMRKAIFEAVQNSLVASGTWKEGVNNFPMPDGRKLKVTNALKRDIEESQITSARAMYDMQNDKPVLFDDLLRVKYELAKAEWNKLPDAAKHAISGMISTKQDTVTVALA